MAWYPIAFLPPQYVDESTNAPYSGAVLKAYSDGTTTVIPMATGIDGATTATSFALNAAGYPVSSGGAVVIPHVQEDYKLALYPNQTAADADSGAIWTVDNITIADANNDPFLEKFSGDGTTKEFTLSTDLGTDEKTLLVFADRLREYSTNGDFAADTNWTKGTGWTIGSGVATAAGAISTSLEQDAGITLIEGESYTVTMTITRTAGGVTPSIGGTDGTEQTSDGTYTETIIAGSDQKIEFAGNGFTGTIDNVSVTRVNSTHREILSDTEFTLDGTSLTLVDAPPQGTNNILVFAPSLLLGAIGASADAAAQSETNAANSEAAAAASETAAETAETNAVAAAASFIEYTFSDETSMADPGTGNLRFNNASYSIVAGLAIDDLTAQAGNPDIGSWLETWGDSTSTDKGTIRIVKKGDPNTYVVFKISGLANFTGWVQVVVSHVSSNGTFADGDNILVHFTASGDVGVGTPADGSVTYPKIASAIIASVAEMVSGLASHIINAANFKSYMDTYVHWTYQTIDSDLSSGTPASVSLSSIPDHVQDIEIIFDEVGQSGTTLLEITLTDTAEVTSGYDASVVGGNDGSSLVDTQSDTAFRLLPASASFSNEDFYGTVRFSRTTADGNTWAISGILAHKTSALRAGFFQPMGTVTLSSDLTALTIATDSGTFNAGSITARYR